MTNEQILQVKKYIEGAFPQVKEKVVADLVWFDMMRDEEYYGIMQSVRNYVKKGKPFPPSIGEIINGYELTFESYQDSILNQMDLNGYFGNDDNEIETWNRKNRKLKAVRWVLKLLPAPDWFIEDYRQYKNMKISTNDRKMIGD